MKVLEWQETEQVSGADDCTDPGGVAITAGFGLMALGFAAGLAAPEIPWVVASLGIWGGGAVADAGGALLAASYFGSSSCTGPAEPPMFGGAGATGGWGGGLFQAIQPPTVGI